MDTLAAAEEETWTGIVTVGHHRNSHIMRLLPLGLLLPAAIGEPGSKTPLTDPNMFGTFIPPANRGPITLGIFTAGVNPAFFEPHASFLRPRTPLVYGAEPLTAVAEINAPTRGHRFSRSIFIDASIGLLDDEAKRQDLLTFPTSLVPRPHADLTLVVDTQVSPQAAFSTPNT
ncbi:hypothetical protein D9619_005189 [Psilocybe cf. subviscida]|uniref:Uncharacterized protein n=1 Tax=Psilocybe cf. subviscida TaxID=2480587 RepID=A0A8H5FBB0_9AGAR|nr:hypothetical protein D9619_005189 [Psilocybe cf. subviscida]